MSPLRDPHVPSLVELQHIDGLLEHRVRLTICVLLAGHDAMSFSRLQELLSETGGSLGAHLRKLEDAGYLTLDKGYRNRRPVTWYRLSPRGHRQLNRHLTALAGLIERAG